MKPSSKILVRCSSLPLLFSCSNAVLNPAGLVAVRVENGQENLGTDIHAAIQKTVETGEADFSKIEARYSPENVERAKTLWAAGLKVVERARRDMKNPQFEQEVSFESTRFKCVGHIDVLDLAEKEALLLDFKTGRTRDDHYHQLAGYAVGAWGKLGRPSNFKATAVPVYLESTEEPIPIHFTVADLEGWLRELDSLAERYTVNRRCVYCPLNNTCPAFRDYLKGSMGLLLDTAKIGGFKYRNLPAPDRAKLHLVLKMADTAVKRVRDHIKEDAIAHGDIPTGNGNKYTIRERPYRTLLAARALPVIAKYVTSKDILNATKLSLRDLEFSAAKRVKGPMKNIIREEMTKRLDAAGAIVVSSSTFLETVVDKPKGKECPATKKTKKPKK